MRQRRNIDVFSLSFMDCICCGFGAIILLFVLTIGPIKKQTHAAQRGVDAYTQTLILTLDQIRSAILSKDSRISSTLSTTPVETNIQALQQQLVDIEETIESRRQAIAKAMSDMQALEQQVENNEEINISIPSTPVGVPTDSTHLIFLIDTSGSMRNTMGLMNSSVIRQVERTLDAYPEVKGIQIIDSSGSYILPNTRKVWLPDSPKVRRNILQELQAYPLPSTSNPIPGLVKIFKDFKPNDPENADKNIAVYIFGDEFPMTAAPVLRELNKLNPQNPQTGKRKVVINATGFPFRLPKNPQPSGTGYKYANLMRELTYEHGGAFMVVGSGRL